MLSVVIPTHNKLELLKQTLDALAKQETGGEAFELVVVDDASSDGTSNWLHQRRQTWPGEMHIVDCPHNVGRARARNLGAAEATGRWLLFMDDDIVAPPDLLQSHLDLLRTDETCGVIGLVETDPGIVDAPHFHYIDSRGVGKISGEIVPSKYLVTQNTSLPRQAFLDCGGFDERFTAYGFEDMELGFRLEDRAGIVFHALRSPVPRHVHHHDLQTYLDKKTLCAQGSLQLIGRLHPARMDEMRLGRLLDANYVYLWTIAALKPLLTACLGIWPTGLHSLAKFTGLYNRLMDAAIYSAYCQGVLRYDNSPDR
jgi:glycosyltransferase involved in cell wall biosynthesis